MKAFLVALILGIFTFSAVSVETAEAARLLKKYNRQQKRYDRRYDRQMKRSQKALNKGNAKKAERIMGRAGKNERKYNASVEKEKAYQERLDSLQQQHDNMPDTLQ